jgi:A/G-specific adenine glycosylase
VETGGDDLTPLQEALLAWFGDEGRDLPWRRSRDPWAILVSETMLQQTQVPRVVPRFLSFMERWGTPLDCAQASRADIVRSWDGLGFNRRALLLHDAARRIADEHDGVVPRTYEQIVALPGVGPYTAKAVLAFAYEDDHGVLDTNVARVLARAVANRMLRRTEAQQLADSLVPSGRAWAWNQAMLDVGARHCKKTRIDCTTCPLVTHCAWRSSGSAVDPAIGTAGASVKQSDFHTSDRKGRGRLISALRKGPVSIDQIDVVMGWQGDIERATRVVRGLIEEGFVVQMHDGVLALSEGVSKMPAKPILFETPGPERPAGGAGVEGMRGTSIPGAKRSTARAEDS